MTNGNGAGGGFWELTWDRSQDKLKSFDKMGMTRAESGIGTESLTTTSESWYFFSPHKTDNLKIRIT